MRNDYLSCDYNGCEEKSRLREDKPFVNISIGNNHYDVCNKHFKEILSLLQQNQGVKKNV